ncbi:MAG: TonB-dependent receptor, partial [Acidobacteria bacterium]
GPQFDPKDVDSIEMQRGGYSAEFGDRTYGVFNVVTRSGFERNREGELVLNYGSFNSTDDQISFGSHSDRFAYYTSVSGNRSEYGLETPITEILHDGRAGLSNFTSLIFNPTSIDQLRLVTSLRGDHYQIPNNFDLEAAGIRDAEDERDAFVNFSWVRTAGHGVLITLSPFYHFNRANYEGGRSDTPLIPQQERGSHYAGGEFAVAALAKKHNVRFGIAGFGQHDNELFGLTDPAANSSLRQRVRPSGDSESLYAEDQWRALSWLTLNGGVRLSRFAGGLTETAADPRVGAAIELPKIHWVLRGFYGRYYQPPPLSTVAGPIVDLALNQGFGFLPLRGERDEQAEAGLSIPFRNWAFEWDAYQTHARNFFDHDVLGNSNIFFPLTIERARIRGWEASLRSPQLFRRGKLHLAFAHQFVQGKGGVNGGLTDFSPPEDEFFYLDHDQRDTLSFGGEVALPWRVAASANFNYGSGFLEGDGPGHLPSHSTFDLALRRSFGETWEAELTGHLLDTSNTFGGTHYADPRQLSITLRYRFHY